MLRICSLDFHKFLSLDTPGVTVDYPQIQRNRGSKGMEIAQDVETMRSFVCMVNYLNQFSPHLTELSDLLREICRQKMEFKLTPACKVAFQRTRAEIS